MEKEFEKNLVLRTLNLQREYALLRSESMSSNLIEKVKEELNELITPLIEFVNLERKENGPDRVAEQLNSGLRKLFSITETITDGYEKHYLQEIKSRVRCSFENCEKPQLLFKDKVDNSSAPFVPKLKEKHNQLVPLDPYFVEYQKTGEIPPDFKFPHPYQNEIDQLKMDYPLLLKTFSKQINSVNLDSTSFTYIDSPNDLQVLINKLSSKTSIFFDAHNHSFRSFLGFTCFIEISTDSEDFVIDALKLREQLYMLNKPFSDPKILKVGMDTQEKILWFQRDFGIYVVNLIDLRQVINRLSLPNSLPFLANKFLNFSFKDVYTDFDFRKRPITNKEKLFLRCFSHLLLRLFYTLKDLVPKFSLDAFFEAIFEDSKKICLRVYEKPPIDDVTSKFLGDSKLNLHTNRRNKLKKLISWRDYTARLEDESKEYIFPDELIMIILCETPESVEGLKSLIKSYPLEVSTQHLDTIFSIIEDNDTFQENKEISKHEVNENSSEILQSLFTPTRPLFRPMSGNLLEKESPAYDQGELHRIIHWSSGKKDMGEPLETPRKLFDDFLMSSAIRDSPNENLSEDLVHIRNIINNRNDPNYVKREVQKIPFLRDSDSGLKEIREEDPAVDALEFSTIKENLPQNIGEIYELGNNIRKRNKNKKKKELKQPKMGSEFPSSLDFSQLSSQGDNSYRNNYGQDKKSSKEEIANSDNILRDLGWI